jgi:hypothetical protein
MAADEMNPVLFDGGPSEAGGRGGAEHRNAFINKGVPDVRSALGGPSEAGGRGGAEHRSAFINEGVPDVRSTLGGNGQIVIARGAKDERLV